MQCPMSLTNGMISGAGSVWVSGTAVGGAAVGVRCEFVFFPSYGARKLHFVQNETDLAYFCGDISRCACYAFDQVLAVLKARKLEKGVLSGD